jgi:hypothetical protein
MKREPTPMQDAQRPQGSLRAIRYRDLLIVWVAALAVLCYALAAQGMSAGRFPLDDSWIHQVYARNLGLTGRWDYVPGVPSAGSTSPFYTLLLAIGYSLRLPYLPWTHLIGAGALALGGVVGAHMADRLFPGVRRAGLLTGLALVLAWHLVWAAASGMETMLFGALCLAVIYLTWAGARQPNAGDAPLAAASASAAALSHFGAGVAFGMLGAILIATRPEGVLLLALLGVAVLVVRPQGAWGSVAAWAGGALLGGVLGVMPYALLNLSTNGTLLPNTFSAKQNQAAGLIAQGFGHNLLRMLEPLTAGGQLVLLPAVIITLVQRLRTPRRIDLLLMGVPLLWSAALIVLYTARLPAPFQHGRYIIPALPTFIVIGVGATLTLASRRYRRMADRVMVRVLALTAAGVFLVYAVLGANIFATDVWRIESDMVTAAQWVAREIPPDQLLAAHDIGAVGYFAPRPLLDIAGLVSPETIPYYHDPAGMLALMQARGVRYVMLLPVQTFPLWLDYVCERFNAGGGMDGMRIYEFKLSEECD